MSQGVFILSLDCEGKWGFADRIDELPFAHQLTNDRLFAAYRNLAQVLRRYNISATFAYVGLFGSEPAQCEKHLDHFRSSAAHRVWMETFLKHWDSGNIDGWFCPETVALVRAEGCHEIACHGFTHLPFRYAAADESARDFELRESQRWAKSLGLTLQTIVFPRNELASIELLDRHAFTGYRECSTDAASRFGRLFNELSTSFRSQHPKLSRAPVAIPAGYFLNWRYSARRLIPLSITCKRWRAVLDDAVHSGGVAHLWFHPHNLLTGDRQIDLLELCLREVAELREAGAIRILTQQQFCAEISQTSA